MLRIETLVDSIIRTDVPLLISNLKLADSYTALRICATEFHDRLLEKLDSNRL